jgi:hypothetical protein
MDLTAYNLKVSWQREREELDVLPIPPAMEAYEVEDPQGVLATPEAVGGPMTQL